MINEPGCEPECRGCYHRNIPVTDSILQKTEWLQKVLEPWAGVIAPIAYLPWEQQAHYRDKVSLQAVWMDGRWQFGMTRKGKVIPIPDCPLHDERIRKTIALLSAHLPGAESLSLVHYVQAGAQLVLVTDIVPREGLKWDEKLFRALLECGNDGIWLHINPHAHEKIFARESWQFLFGRQRSMSSLNLIYGPMSYQQIIPGFYRHAITAARDFFDFRPGDGIADLYCGTGGSLVAWTLAGAEGIGIDINHEAVECARMNLVGTLVLRGKCAERLDQLDQWIVYKELKRFLLYTNPPKTGMEPEVIQWILNTSRPERIGYMSCHAATLSREINQLSEGGYRVVQILPYDTYPRTHHLECLALLEKAT